MSQEKREQLIAAGLVREDGSRIERCGECLRPFEEGKDLIDTRAENGADPQEREISARAAAEVAALSASSLEAGAASEGDGSESSGG
jgi:hypothetical protein